MKTQTGLSRQRASALELLTIPATAERLGCSDNHVYRLIAAGELRPVDIAPAGARRSKTRVRSDDVDGYIDRKTRERHSPRQAHGTGKEMPSAAVG
jgi:excisionase family DNA binding protein